VNQASIAENERIMKRCTALLGVLVAGACGSDDGRANTSDGGISIGTATPAEDSGVGGETGSSSSGPASDETDQATDGGGIKLDVGSADESGSACADPTDVCCLEPGELPPHALLDAFLLAYPPAAMPKTVADIQAFAPMADGHAMAWSDENSGGELIDATEGGVIEENVLEGREIARQAALLALPPGAMVVAMRDELATIEVLPGEGVCNGVGWAWGSMLFEAADLSIGELVYLYIGFCADRDMNADSEDVEVFYYSDEAVQICAPPG